MKRIISVLLILCMIFTTFSFSFAETNSGESDAKALYDLGIISGSGYKSDGTPDFNLNATLTRAEAITMLVKLLGAESKALSGNYKSPFVDLSAWSKPYINYAYNNGLVGGTSATTFSGENKITATEYLTLILKVLGYEMGTDFTWDKAYLLTNAIGMTNGEYNVNRQIQRSDLMAITNKSLSINKKSSTNDLLAYLVDLKAVDKAKAENYRNKNGSSVPIEYTEEKVNNNKITGVEKIIEDAIRKQCPYLSALRPNQEHITNTIKNGEVISSVGYRWSVIPLYVEYTFSREKVPTGEYDVRIDQHSMINHQGGDSREFGAVVKYDSKTNQVVSISIVLNNITDENPTYTLSKVDSPIKQEQSQPIKVDQKDESNNNQTSPSKPPKLDIQGGVVCGLGEVTASSIEIPEYDYEGNKVTKIKDYAFYERSNIKSVKLPEGLTEIGGSAFSRSGIESIIIPSSVRTIGKYAFDHCPNLKSVKLSNGLEIIDEFAFCDSGLESITIPASVKKVGRDAFGHCSNLKTVNIEYGLTEIPELAFGYSGLESITIPSSVKTIGEEAFYNCYNLKSVTIPSSVKTIGEDAFFECSNLRTLNLSEGVEKIGKGAFYRCALEFVKIPSTLTRIECDVFDCLSLKTVEVSKNTTYIDQWAFGLAETIKYDGSLEEFRMTEGLAQDRYVVKTILETPFGIYKFDRSIANNEPYEVISNTSGSAPTDINNNVDKPQDEE
ncbi:MAG: leucine-rich repeat domain-containing protein, partial [Clostridia bacterium]|nr:leucine-rich repeat domain-containing protein [Clostridia bacterium]